mmetsp:Transcript_2566/g.6060  ORF Transcript_2566/g.6060 Transcript_2566/m.6060 type:complete len:217 (-) Transcript_2566:2176-2826(-)
MGNFALPNASIGLVQARLGEDEEPVVPRGVVQDVFGNHPGRALHLAVPLCERADEPLPVSPGVVMLGIVTEHLVDECDFAGNARRAEVRYHEAAVVPELVVLRVDQVDLAHELELCPQGFLRDAEGFQDASPVLPQSVVGRVDEDQLRRQVQGSRAPFSRRHERPHEGHAIGVLLVVKDLHDRLDTLDLWDGLHILPLDQGGEEVLSLHVRHLACA